MKSVTIMGEVFTNQVYEEGEDQTCFFAIISEKLLNKIKKHQKYIIKEDVSYLAIVDQESCQSYLRQPFKEADISSYADEDFEANFPVPIEAVEKHLYISKDGIWWEWANDNGNYESEFSSISDIAEKMSKK